MPAEEQKLHEIDHAVARRLFKEYVQAKKAAGQSTKGLSYGKMLAKLSAEAGRLKEKLGDDIQVRFQVKTIDGKVRLRALRDKGESPAAPPKLAPPKLAPPPIPGKLPPKLPGKAKAPSVAPPPLAVPAVPPAIKPLDETDEELGTTDIDHDDLDEMEEVDPAEFEAGPEDSMRATLAALMEQENEPLPATAGGTGADLTASQKINFATLGDIARRMDELAERREAPAKAAKAEHDREVLEGESSGEADIRSVAASLKKKMAPEPEEGAPTGAIEGDSIPISLTDEDEVAAVGGFGTSAAVSLAEHKPIVSAEADDDDDEPPTRHFTRDAATGLADETQIESQAKGGFPVGILLLLIVVVAGGVGYVMYGDQLLGGQAQVASRNQPASAPETAPPLELSPRAVESGPAPEGAGTEGGDPTDPAPTAGETTGHGEMVDDADADAGEVDDGTKKKKTKRTGTGRPGPDDGDAPDDAGDPPPDDSGGAEAADSGDGEPEPKDDKQGEVDCLLNPSAPGCKKEPAVIENKEEAPALPDKLSQNQLRDGFQAVKNDAKLCGTHHGAESGAKVSVKVSIEGKTGGITKADPQGEYSGTALGKCVADALRRATFPPFAAPAMGVTWTIRM